MKDQDGAPSTIEELVTRRDLEAMIAARFTREREDLESRAQFVFTVLKWVGATLVIALGLFGIKAWSDIKRDIETEFRARLVKTYRVEDPNAPTTRTINRLVAQALVNALLTRIELSRLPDSRHTRRVPLLQEEKDQLTVLLRSKGTDRQQFEDTLVILDTLLEARDERESTSVLVSRLLAAEPRGEFSWMAENESKRVAILDTFNNAESVDVVATRFVSTTSSDRLRREALKRIRKDVYTAAVPALLKYMDTAATDEEKRDAALTVARLRPDHPTMINYYKSLSESDSDPTVLLHCIQIAAALEPRTHQFLEDDENKKRKQQLVDSIAVPLAEKAFAQGVHITLSPFSNRLEASIATGASIYRSVPMESDLYSGLLFADLLKKHEASIGDLGVYLRAITPTSEVSEETTAVEIFGLLASNSKIVLSNGQVLTQKEVRESKVQFRVNAVTDSLEKGQMRPVPVLVGWTDVAAVAHDAQVSRVEFVEFSIKAHLPRTDDSDLD